MKYTKEDALQALEDMDDYSRMGVPGGVECIGAYGVLKTFIEEACAQLEEDAKILSWWFSDTDKDDFIEEYMQGVSQHWTISQWREVILDAIAREQGEEQ